MMFGIGFAELIIVAIVIFLAVKPEDLPDIIKKSRQAYGTLKSVIDGFKERLYAVEEELTKEMDLGDKNDRND